MSLTRRDFLKLSGAALGSASLGATGLSTLQWSRAQPQVALQDPALHLLRRTSFGQSPVSRARFSELGPEAFLAEQLEPSALKDEAADAFLQKHPALNADEMTMRRANKDGALVGPALQLRLLRALYSERQLFERTVDVWNDHFNVPIRGYVPERILMDREVVRPHAFGRFRDLLHATARSSAVLRYLDNASSDKANPNENYARELLELHTLGVTGPYTEDDVQDVARAFTGWTLNDSWPGRFYFDADKHDTNEKTVLGVTMSAGRGIEDGLQVLDLLAHHPATARFVSWRFARHFVSDEVPEDLLESSTQTFLETQGDIRALLRHIFTSEAFAASAGQKFRRPFEYTAALLRSFGPALELRNPELLNRWLKSMGQQPYHWLPPSGYPDVADAWLNSNGLLNRWNLALFLPRVYREGVKGAHLDLASLLPSPEGDTVASLIDRAADQFLATPLTDEDRAELVYLVSDYADPAQPVTEALRRERLPSLLGLLLASPYMQWT